MPKRLPNRLLRIPRYYLTLVLVAGLMSACADHGAAPEPEETPEQTEPTVSFSADVHPILLTNCNFSGCHGSASTRHEFEVTSYATITADTPTYGRHVISGDADSSPLYIAISARFAELGQPLRMPRSLDSLSTVQQELIRTWIDEGALDN
jgi:hypothetical protein